MKKITAEIFFENESKDDSDSEITEMFSAQAENIEHFKAQVKAKFLNVTYIHVHKVDDLRY